MMTEHEVLQRNNAWLNEIKQIAEKHSAAISFEREVFKIGIDEKNFAILNDVCLYDVLMFMRGFNVCHAFLESSGNLMYTT